jgi:hypothetical protein
MPELSTDQAIDAAVALHQAGKFAEAEKIYLRILARHPKHPDVLHLLGAIATQTGRPQQAIDLISQAIAVHPAAIYYNNLGKAFMDTGRPEQAADAYQRAILLKPDYFEAHNNLGVTLKDMEQLDQAIAASQTALRLKPDYPQAHWSLALGLLLKGDFENGWREYEWRLRCAELPRPLDLRQPRWDGKALHGKTILLHTEQGYGDMLQFVRYAEMVAHHGGRVILACPPEMAPLMKSCPGVSEVAPLDQPLPRFDVHCPLGSLPLIFGTTLQTIPAPRFYLKADDDLIEKWRTRIGEARAQSHSPAQSLRCGIVWSGNPRQSNDRHRSMRLDQLTMVLSFEAAQFHSLQKGAAADQIKSMATQAQLVDYSEELTDFAETAAAIANLDLVITVDTAVAHLGGALGKPVWVMLSRPFDWRYLLDRSDSPWYPAMRLFRQKTAGDWDEVILRVAEALATFAGN